MLAASAAPALILLSSLFGRPTSARPFVEGQPLQDEARALVPGVFARNETASPSATFSNTSSASPAEISQPPLDETIGASLCASLPAALTQSSSLKFNSTPWTQFYPAGSNPSLELLVAQYPDGWIPSGTDVPAILSGVGPDIDITKELGYGRTGQNDESMRIANNGPLGGLPAFCRYVSATLLSAD